jgi:ABC-type Fe3+-citrate transport system substrate-binding protein
VTQEAKSVGPRVTANAEQVIALDPDLIVSGVTREECLKSLTQAQ